jgi:hypothetical protein
MKRITITQEFNIPLPLEYDDSSPEEIMNMLNRMYDIHGQGIIQAMDAESDYTFSRVTHIDDEPAYCEIGNDGCYVMDSGHDIILDGQVFNSSHP